MNNIIENIPENGYHTHVFNAPNYICDVYSPALLVMFASLLLFLSTIICKCIQCVTFLLYCYVVFILILWFKGSWSDNVLLMYDDFRKSFLMPISIPQQFTFLYFSLVWFCLSTVLIRKSLEIWIQTHTDLYQSLSYHIHIRIHIKKMDSKLSSFCLSPLCVRLQMCMEFVTSTSSNSRSCCCYFGVSFGPWFSLEMVAFLLCVSYTTYMYLW